MANQGIKMMSSVCRKMGLLRLQGIKSPAKCLSSFSTCYSNHTSTRSDAAISGTPVSLQTCETLNNKFAFNLFTSESKEYICPPAQKNLDVVILDRSFVEKEYDCPTILNTIHDIIAPHISKKNIISPPPKTNSNVPIEAKNIMKIRRRKMNRHILKKYKKKNVYKLRIQKQMMRKKKEVIFSAHLKTFTTWAEDFNAEEFVKSELKAARRGGFMVDIYSTRDKTQSKE